MENSNPSDLTVLVTGAGGYLGSSLVKHLCESGHHVVALYRSSLPETHPRSFPVCIDLESENLLASPLRGVDLLIHTAWENNFIGPDKKSSESLLANSANLQVLQKLIRAVEKAGTKHFIFLSAMGASYKSSNSFLREKYMGESLVLNSNIPHKMIVRQSILVGRGKKSDSFVSSILGYMKIPFLYPKPPKTGAFHPLHIEDWLKQISKCIQKRSSEKIALISLAGQEAYPAEEIFSLVSSHCFMGGRIALPRVFSKILFPILEKKKKSSEKFLNFSYFQSFSEASLQQEEGWVKPSFSEGKTRSFEEVLKIEYLPNL